MSAQNDEQIIDIVSEDTDIDRDKKEPVDTGTQKSAKNKKKKQNKVDDALNARIEELEGELEKSDAEIVDLKDQFLRKQADFENFRKRMFREKEDSIQYANSNLISDLVTIIDDFERAIKSSEDSKDFDLFHSGIELIEKQFISMLERKWGLKRFESVNEEFDPQLHEAINMEESDEYDTQVVLEDYQKGYMLHNRVLRHSKVKVSMPATEQKPPVEAEENDKENKEEIE